MLDSIITVCRNAETTIESSIQSVLKQDYPNIEYIVIDGKSSDKTISIIEKYSDKISKFISEKDEGMYFALNKGIRFATGDIIGLVHADDFYSNAKIISRIVKEFAEKKVDSVYGDLQYIEKGTSHKISCSYIPEVLVKMKTGGISNVTLKSRIKANKEDRLAWKINGLKPNSFTLILKPLSKLRQFLP